MSKLKDAVVQGVAGDAIDPAYLEDEPKDMAGSYAQVFYAFASGRSPYVRLTNWPGEPCSECGQGLVRKLVAKVPGVVRFDGCCANCGKNEFHTAGWTNDDAGNKARNAARKAVAK